MSDDKVTLILDDTPHSSAMIKDTVLSLGMKPIRVISTIDEAKKSVLSENLSVIIMEMKLENESTLELVNWLRKINNQNKTVPIIALTQNATKELVTSARDTGVSEFVLKPFTSAALSSAILSVMKHPRNFIITRNYAGPDRRRKEIAPPDGEEKRNVIKHKDNATS